MIFFRIHFISPSILLLCVRVDLIVSPASKGSSKNVGLIVGIVAGVVAAFAVLLLIVLALRCVGFVLRRVVLLAPSLISLTILRVETFQFKSENPLGIG